MFRIGATGIIVNQHNQVLLIQRDDTRTWAPPAGSLDPNELPDAAAAREVREETGLIVMPVRLVSVSYIPLEPEPLLTFTFRCIQRGGELTPSPESPKVGFVDSNNLPRSMASFHRQRLQQAFAHQTSYPFWYSQPLNRRSKFLKGVLDYLIYPYKDLQRKWRGLPPYEPPETWRTSAFAVIQDEKGAVLWVQRTDQDVWNLPGGRSLEREAPWETAVRETKEETGLDITLDNLTGVYTYKTEKPYMVFVFTATVQSGTLTTGAESAAFRYIPLGEEPDNSVAQHIERVQDALSPIDITIFKQQEGPHLIVRRD